MNWNDSKPQRFLVVVALETMVYSRNSLWSYKSSKPYIQNHLANVFEQFSFLSSIFECNESSSEVYNGEDLFSPKNSFTLCAKLHFHLTVETRYYQKSLLIVSQELINIKTVLMSISLFMFLKYNMCTTWKICKMRRHWFYKRRNCYVIMSSISELLPC